MCFEFQYKRIFFKAELVSSTAQTATKNLFNLLVSSDNSILHGVCASSVYKLVCTQNHSE